MFFPWHSCPNTHTCKIWWLGHTSHKITYLTFSFKGQGHSVLIFMHSTPLYPNYIQTMVVLDLKTNKFCIWQWFCLPTDIWHFETVLDTSPSTSLQWRRWEGIKNCTTPPMILSNKGINCSRGFSHLISCQLTLTEYI
jgi:hypothetical protein